MEAFPPRRAVGIAAVPASGVEDSAIYVLCTDGKVFEYSHELGMWIELPPIPGTLADPPPDKP